MSLFRIQEKFSEESEISVELKARLDVHLPTYETAFKLYSERCQKCRDLEQEVLEVRREGSSQLRLKNLTEEFQAARFARDEPLHTFNLTTKDIRNQLERATSPFIQEKAEEWEAEIHKASSAKIFKEENSIKNAEGKKSYTCLSNLHKIARFQEKILEDLMKLRSMINNSIPEIRIFIDATEKELKAIDLSPEPVDIDRNSFNDLQEIQRDANEKVKAAIGFGLSNGVHVLGSGTVQTPGEMDKSLFDKAAALADRYK